MDSKLAKTFRIAFGSSKKIFRSEWAQNLLKRSELHSEAIWCITTHSELEKIVSLRMRSKLTKTFRIAFWRHLVHHSSFWARKNCSRTEWAQNLLKRSELHSEDIWCIIAHFELEKSVSLRMGSKLAKTFRIAFWSHLVHHNSFWARKNCFAPNAIQNLLKRSELHSEAIWCITTHSELEKIVSLRMRSKLAKTFRIAFWSHLVHHNSFWARKNSFAPNGSKLAKTFRIAFWSHLVHHNSFWARKNCFAPNGLKTC